MIRKFASAIGMTLCLLSFVSVAKSTDNLAVEGAYIKLLPEVVTTNAGYMTVKNQSSKAMTLISASSPFSNRIEFHNHVMESGMMKMQQQLQVMIPENSSREFAPGGLHLMLFDVDVAYRQHKEIPMTLRFDDGTHLDISFSIGKQAKTESDANSHHHHSHH